MAVRGVVFVFVEQRSVPMVDRNGYMQIFLRLFGAIDAISSQETLVVKLTRHWRHSFKYQVCNVEIQVIHILLPPIPYLPL